MSKMKNENSLKIMEKNNKYCMKNFEYFPLVIKECEGSIIRDVDGNEFIDFLCSASSLNLGSRHPVVIKAINDQLDKFTQYCFAYFRNEQSIEYARLLTSVYPGGVKTKVVR